MQYKLYVDDEKWLPELPEINRGQILDHLVGVDVPQLYAVGGEDMLFKKLGIYNINSSVLFTDEALREKIQIMTKMLPVLHYLEEESLKKMSLRMDAQAAGHVMVSTQQKEAVEGLMKKSISASQGGVIVWILTKGLPPINCICPIAFNPREIMSQVALELCGDKKSTLHKSQSKRNATLCTMQTKYRAAVARRTNASKYILREVARNRVTVIEEAEYCPGLRYLHMKLMLL